MGLLLRVSNLELTLICYQLHLARYLLFNYPVD